MRKILITTAAVVLAACSSHKPLPMNQSAVSIWNVSPMSASLRQSGGGAQYQLTASGDEHRGIATLRLFDAGKSDVQFFFPDFKALDSFSLATRQARFQCGTQRPASGVQYSCVLNGKAVLLGKSERVAATADGIRVTVPAELFSEGQTVQVEWLEYFR